MKVTSNDERYVVRSVTRALDLLTALGALGGTASLAELSAATGLNPSTAFRLLESLRARGYATPVEGGSGYALGGHVVDLGTVFLQSVSIWDQARDIADQLADAVAETASVGILDQGQVLYIAIARAQSELGIQSQAGTRHPAYCTALGKVLLAELGWEDAEAILDARPMARLTASTITTKARMRKELEKVRAAGYAVDDEERNPEVVCIAAPITDHSGRCIAALSVSGPAFRIREQGLENIAAVLRSKGLQVSARMGARSPGSSL